LRDGAIVVNASTTTLLRIVGIYDHIHLRTSPRKKKGNNSAP
jgi:hypothetical protein